MRRDHSDLDWPMWVPRGAFVVVSVVAVVAAVQHRHHVPLPLGLLLAAAAIFPFFLESLGKLPPRWISAGLPLAAALVFVARPVDDDVTGFLLVMVASQAASVGTLREGLATAAIACSVIVGVEIQGAYHGALIWVAGIVLGWACGFLMQNSLRLLADLREAQADLAERAAQAERQRIARELHDVLAHTLSVIMLHITGARLALDSDPAEAAAALQQAEQLGRRSLADVRNVVGLLRPGEGGGPELAPQPDASAIEGLVAGYRAAGVEIDVAIDGDVTTVPPQAGLLLYRIVQESLTNVAKHATARTATVRLRVGPPLELEVRSPAGLRPANAGGLGLLGMQERAAAMGGSLRAGLVPDDGEWRVELRVPSVEAVV